MYESRLGAKRSSCLVENSKWQAQRFPCPYHLRSISWTFQSLTAGEPYQSWTNSFRVRASKNVRRLCASSVTLCTVPSTSTKPYLQVRVCVCDKLIAFSKSNIIIKENLKKNKITISNYKTPKINKVLKERCILGFIPSFYPNAFITGTFEGPTLISENRSTRPPVMF